MIEISTLQSAELKKLVKGLKLYADMSKKIGKRGKTMFLKDLVGKNIYKLEYMLPLTEDEAWDEGQKAFLKAFGTQPTREEVVFFQNNNLLGGIKVFQNDMMVDLSFSKAAKHINI